MRRPYLPLILGAVLCAAWLKAPASGPRGEEPTPPELRTSVSSIPSPLPSPGSGVLKFTILVPSGYHIFGGESLSVQAKGPQGVTFGKPTYPKGTMEEDQEVLRGRVLIEVPVTLPSGEDKDLKGSFLVDWQACQDFGEKVCFLPTQDAFPFEVPVTTQAQSELIVPPAPLTPAVTTQVTPSRTEPHAASPKSTESGYQKRFADAAKNNVSLALLLAFLFGILSSLTPCIYPIIPITVGFIGGLSQGKGKWWGFSLSLFYVLGLCLVYSALGLIAASSKVAFGSLTQSPWVGVPVATVFFVLSLFMFNLFEFKLPSALVTKIEQTKHKGRGRGIAGAFLIGALSGLVVSPCIGPLVLAILVVISTIGSPVLGFGYMFAYALGLGVLFMVVGTSSAFLANLPKSGSWMDGVRILFGALILGASFYFASLYLPPLGFRVVALSELVAVILFLLLGAKRHYFSVLWRAIGIVLAALAFAVVFWFFAPGHQTRSQAGETEVAWRADLTSALVESSSQKKPALLDFRADWCVACVELERKTWPNKEVGALLSSCSVPVRLDMTKNTQENRSLEARYSVMGLPTVILLAPDGKELGRFVGFKAPDDFTAWYREAVSSGPGS